MKKIILSVLMLAFFVLAASKDSMAQVKISGMVETKEDPAGGWIPVVLNNKNYKYNPGSYVQQKTIDNIRGLSPTNLPANYVYYVTDPGKQGFFRYDNADAASVDDGAVVLVTKNNLRFKRIIENNTVNAKWFEMGDAAAAINTLIYLNNTAITYAQAQAIFNTAKSRVTISTTDFTTQNATWFALQRAINFCLQSGNKLYIPAGQYTVSKGLLVADMGNYVSGFEVQGAATTYNGSDSQTVLNFTDKNSFGLGFHRVKGLRVRNLFLRGQDAIAGTLYDWFENPAMDWLHGCRNTTVSPHAGFIVDPLFNEGSGGEPDKYPGFESVYTDPEGHGGSTDVIFDNCRVEQFVVGYCFSPHGAPQNGDNIAVNNSWVNYCKSGISIGQSQNRSVVVNNLKCWGGVETLFDNLNYSDGMADQVDVDVLQIAGGVKYLSRIGGWAFKGLQIRRMHAESLYSLGGAIPVDGANNYANNAILVIEDSHINLEGSGTVHAARTAFTGQKLWVKNSLFGHYGTAGNVVINAVFAKFENCALLQPVINLPTGRIEVKQTDIIDCADDKGYGHRADELGARAYQWINSGDEWQMNRSAGHYRRIPTRATPLNAPPTYYTVPTIHNTYTFHLSQPNITLTSVDHSTRTAEFSLPVGSNDFNVLQPVGITSSGFVGGDHLYVFSFATNGWESFELGTVESKDAATGKVRLKDIAAGITTGTPYLVAIARPMRLLTSFMMGNSTAGSNVIGNVYSENNTLLDWSGFTIVSPHFPAGTYIVSTDANAKTFTMSNKATATVNGMEVIWADWNAVEYGTEPFSYQNGYGYSGYRQGDVIYNNDPIKYPDVEKRVCVKSGLLGWPVPSPYVPEFTTYYKEVSSAFKPTSNTTTGSTITNGQMVVSKGRFIQNIVVSSDKALSVQIGTTLGGSDILANTSLTANTVNRVLTVNKFCTVGSATTTTLYVRFTQTNTPPTAVTANVNLTVMR